MLSVYGRAPFPEMVSQSVHAFIFEKLSLFFVSKHGAEMKAVSNLSNWTVYIAYFFHSNTFSNRGNHDILQSVRAWP